MTQQVLATGQVSLVDLNDAKTLSAYLGIVSASPANTKQQGYDPNTATYTPNWGTNNMIIAPQLYLSGGGGTNLIGGVTSVTWYEVTAAGATAITSGSSNYTIAASNATNPYALTIAANKMTTTDWIGYRCDIVWPDPDLPTGSNGIAVSADIQFAKMTAGSNSALMMLTNENQSVPADSVGNVLSYTGCSTTATIYAGSVDKSTDYTWATPVFNPTAYYTTTAATVSADKRTVTFSDIKSTVDSVAVTLQGTHNVTGAVVQKIFTVSKNKQGISSTEYTLNIDTKLMTRTGAGATAGGLAPSSINATMYSATGGGTATPYLGRLMIDELISGTWTNKYTSSANEASATKSYSPGATATQVRVRLYVKDTAVVAANYLDEEIITITTANEGVVSVLSNDNQTFATKEDGTVSSWPTISSTMTVYVGGIDDTANWTFAQTPSSNVTLQAPTTTKTITVTAMTVDSGTVTITASKTINGSVVTTSKIFTVSKNRQGFAPTVYAIQNPPTIGRKLDGTYSPAYLSSLITAISQHGNDAPINGPTLWYKIDQELTTSLGTWQSTDAYSSSAAGEGTVARYPLSTANGNSGTFLANLNRVRIRVYTESAFTNCVDTEYIQVVNDGVNSIRAFINPLAGNIINQTTGNVQMKCQVYDGVNPVTGTSYQWYKMDPTATVTSFTSTTMTGSGADSAAGASWRPLTSVSTPAIGSGFAVSQAATGGTVAAGVYYANFSYMTANGETLQATGTVPSVTTTGTTSTLTVTAPTGWPQGVLAVKVYVGTSAAAVKFQGYITTAGGTLTLTTTPSTTNAAPLATSTANFNGASDPTKTGATNFTTDTVTINADGVDSASSYKCVAVYLTKNYSDVVAVIDQSDPIMVTLERPQGDIFRNGQGAKTIIAHLFQGGTEIDLLSGGGTTAEQQYEYRWYLLDKSGNQVTSTTVGGTTYTWVDSGKQYKTGKKVTVDPNLVSGTATLSLQVWSKS